MASTADLLAWNSRVDVPVAGLSPKSPVEAGLRPAGVPSADEALDVAASVDQGRLYIATPQHIPGETDNTLVIS